MFYLRALKRPIFLAATLVSSSEDVALANMRPAMAASVDTHIRKYTQHILVLSSLSGSEESPGKEMTGIPLFREPQVITGLQMKRAGSGLSLERELPTPTEFPGSDASFELRVRENRPPRPSLRSTTATR